MPKQLWHQQQQQQQWQCQVEIIKLYIPVKQRKIRCTHWIPIRRRCAIYNSRKSENEKLLLIMSSVYLQYCILHVLHRKLHMSKTWILYQSATALRSAVAVLRVFIHGTSVFVYNAWWQSVLNNLKVAMKQTDCTLQPVAKIY